MRRIALIVVSMAALGIGDVAIAKGDVAAGKAKAAANCGSCHGTNGEGHGQFPALAGKREKDIEHAMEDYQSGKRANGVMKALAAKLTHQDIENIAAYYASLGK